MIENSIYTEFLTVPKTQREYLAKLLECLPYEAADELFSIQIS